jgi:hypothetical protein
LITISLAEISNEYVPINNPAEVAQRLVEVKKFLKSQKGSNHLKDRRGRPFTSLEEAETALRPMEKEDSEPLGRALVKAGLIHEDQLTMALAKHFETGERLGQILISMNAVDSEKVGETLAKKLRVPYASLRKNQPSEDILELLDRDFLKSFRVIPFEVTDEDILYLGMVDPANRKVIREVEEITRLKVKPCLVLENEFEEFIDRYGSLKS